MHLKKPGFTYSACGPFTKNKERIEKFMQTGNTDFIYKNELDKACFQHDMAYVKSKDLAKRTQLDKGLRDKASKIASDPKYDAYQRGLASIVYNFFDKKCSGSGVGVLLTNKSATESNHQLANEFRRQMIKTFQKRKVYSSFRDNSWGVNLADMQWLSKYNKEIKYLFCAIDLFSKHAWVVPLKNKRGMTIVKLKLEDANRVKYGLINVVNFTITLLRSFCK